MKLNWKNKKLLFSFMILFLICVVVAGYKIYASHSQKNYLSMRELMEDRYAAVRVSGMGDYFQYDYEELLDYAAIIAVVKSVDDLTTENSFGISEFGNRFYTAFSLRKTEIVECFKGGYTTGDTLEVAEKCVLLSDGTMVAFEDCYPMQKGDYYLLFLNRSGYSGRPYLPISADNGKCDLTNLSLNADRRKPLFIEACMDLISDKKDVSKIEEIQQLEIRNSDETIVADEWESVWFTTPYTASGREIEIKIGKKGNDTMYQIGDYSYTK